MLLLQLMPSTTEYVIKSGDTLGAIAAQFSTSVQNLKSLNGLNPI